jgi:hypothetical protein
MPPKKHIPWWLGFKKPIKKRGPIIKKKGFNNNVMHEEAKKPPAGLQNRIVMVWSPTQQNYNYSPADHSIVTKIGKEEFDIMLGELAMIGDSELMKILRRKTPSLLLYLFQFCLRTLLLFFLACSYGKG